MVTRKELIKKYINFFKEKKHKEIKNSSLIPENDASVLFTSAGMHPLVPFLLGEPHPQGKRLTNVQRCIRTGDIEKVGNSTHHTFFEMLGNWSLGDYFKDETIEWSFEFLTKVLKIPKNRLAVSVFKGDKNVTRDNESAKKWETLGIPKERIAYLDKKDNWWGPAGEIGPCGPDTEIFYWKLNNKPAPQKFDPNDSTLATDGENWVEIWNDVLMEYVKDKNGKYNEAKQKNIDTGMGVERTVAILNGFEDNYLADMWKPLIKEIEKITKKTYKGNEKAMRIIADHIKSSCFILGDGVTPSNIDQGYILRRLIRRAFRNARKLFPSKEKEITKTVAKKVIEIYSDYEILKSNKEKILNELNLEQEKFEKTLDKGLKELEKMTIKERISGKNAFLLFQSYGFPLEMTQELAGEKGSSVDDKGFHEEMKSHQNLSRTASIGKFKGGLSDKSEATKKLHTATHLLNESLRVVLDTPSLQQKGSNITPERLRFDFNFERKLTPEEIKEVEELVNLKIKSNLPVTCKTMDIKKAKEIGAVGVFEEKYGNRVKVYHIGSMGKEFSKELCAGPHVKNTSELGTFKIIKEESSSAGIRRIKAIVE